MEFLLEILTEEMPSSHVKAGLSQLREKIQNELDASRVRIDDLTTYGTCRRLVLVGNFASKQEDKEDVIIGPPRSVAFGPDGSPTPAAQGFAKAQNVSVDQLQLTKTAKGEYVCLKKKVAGGAVEDILAPALPSIIASLSFPKMMRWGEGSLRFSRPIKAILCLCGGKPLAFSLERILARDATSGHKLRSPRVLRVKSFPEYKSFLKKNKVIIDPAERERAILSQIKKRLHPLKAELYPDEELLDKLTYDVEYPFVFRGSFPKGYLQLPLEVLSVAMREGQKLFSVIREGRQLPRFLGVADTTGDPKTLIRRGNERVLRARLEDARFFWEQDRKTPLAQKASSLGQVIYQEKLGSYADKTGRLKQLVSYLCDKLDAKAIKKEALLAAELCKADLTTEMVREFPSLQGKMGGLYAMAEGLPRSAAQAIYEHYQPASLADSSPASLGGAILSIADKLDSIVGVMGLGIPVSGSSDPFGLRRNANGICKIILDHKLIFSAANLLQKAILAYGGTLDRAAEEIRASARTFLEQRLRFICEAKGFRYDLVNAALGAGVDNIYFAYLRLRALDSLQKSPHFEPTILMAKRVNNILRGRPPYRLNSELLVEKEERELFSTFSIVRDNIKEFVAVGDFAKAQNMAFKLRTPLGQFFDRVLVMAEDKKLRQNRLALLQAIARLLLAVADYSQIVVEGEKSAQI
jgi:glycyl-tRNA synthetase beta chain